MSDEPDATLIPSQDGNGEPSETVTAPAGAAPPVPAKRVPKHGHGQLYVSGKIGNKGGYRLPAKVLEQLVEICGLAADEMLLRLQDVEVRTKLTVDELRLILKEAGAFVLPKKYEHSGPEGGPIPLQAVQDTVSGRLRQRLQTLELLHPKRGTPSPEPAPPTTPGTSHAAL